MRGTNTERTCKVPGAKAATHVFHPTKTPLPHCTGWLAVAHSISIMGYKWIPTREHHLLYNPKSIAVFFLHCLCDLKKNQIGSRKIIPEDAIPTPHEGVQQSNCDSKTILISERLFTLVVFVLLGVLIVLIWAFIPLNRVSCSVSPVRIKRQSTVCCYIGRHGGQSVQPTTCVALLSLVHDLWRPLVWSTSVSYSTSLRPVLWLELRRCPHD